MHLAYLLTYCFNFWFLLNVFVNSRRILLPRDAMQARPMSSCGVCLCVCVSVTFVHSVETNKHIFKIFSPSGSHSILVFLCQTAWQYSDGNYPDWGVEYMWGRQKSRFWATIWLQCVLLTLLPAMCYQETRSNHRAASCDTSLVVSGGVCWWRERTAKCLWQEVTALRQRQQNSI